MAVIGGFRSDLSITQTGGIPRVFCFPGCFPLCQTDRSEIIPNIPVRRKRNGPFHLNSDRNFRNLWHNAEASLKSRINENGGNPFHTNHMTTFLCHVTTSFGHHVISFLQPRVQNSNGRFTTLVILIVFLPLCSNTWLHTRASK